MYIHFQFVVKLVHSLLQKDAIVYNEYSFNLLMICYRISITQPVRLPFLRRLIEVLLQSKLVLSSRTMPSKYPLIEDVPVRGPTYPSRRFNPLAIF